MGRVAVWVCDVCSTEIQRRPAESHPRHRRRDDESTPAELATITFRTSRELRSLISAADLALDTEDGIDDEVEIEFELLVCGTCLDPARNQAIGRKLFHRAQDELANIVAETSAEIRRRAERRAEREGREAKKPRR